MELEKHPQTMTLPGVLHGLHSVLAVVPAGTLRPPHLGPRGPDVLKCQLVRIHDLPPVFGCEMFISHGELESFRLHFLHKKRLHGSTTARHLQVDM
jgi:hypothetical protein